MTKAETSVGLDQVMLMPGERRPAILAAIDAAQSHLRLSMFRCTDFKVLDKLAEALQRGVTVELLLTQRAKGWEKKIREIGNYIESMGARVHRYGLPGVKYHAKYLVVDDSLAIISSANLTVKCFEKTSDFLLVTRDAGVVKSLIRLFETDVAAPGTPLGGVGADPRLIVGPDGSRAGFQRLIAEANQSLRIVDHRVKDPQILGLLKDRERAGVDVQIYGKRAIPGLKSHGKMMIIDDERAVLGSISLSPPGLGMRRELSVVIHETACVDACGLFLATAGEGTRLAALKSMAVLEAAGAEDNDDDDDENDEE